MYMSVYFRKSVALRLQWVSMGKSCHVKKNIKKKIYIRNFFIVKVENIFELRQRIVNIYNVQTMEEEGKTAKVHIYSCIKIPLKCTEINHIYIFTLLAFI